jgi:2-polyprenyl-6-methoxyphenol hydroxylase-like FAD-dependent oxidoreductase
LARVVRALAVRLARAGMRVLVFEADRAHTDQPSSTHTIQSLGIWLLDELGVGAQIRAVTPARRTALIEPAPEALTG